MSFLTQKIVETYDQYETIDKYSYVASYEEIKENDYNLNIPRYVDTFEEIKHFTEEGIEFWYARELQVVLEYTKWDNFFNVIEKAKETCKNSKISVSDHFADVGKMVKLGSGAERDIDDIMLSRYACYWIVQNGNPRKEVIALGQSYFAVKTRE